MDEEKTKRIKLLKEIEGLLRNKNDKDRRMLISIGIRSGYDHKEVKEGTAFYLRDKKITVIPRHNKIKTGTARDILKALREGKPIRVFRGQMN